LESVIQRPLGDYVGWEDEERDEDEGRGGMCQGDRGL